MKARILLVSGALCALVFGAGQWLEGSQRPRPRRLVERGEYLVNALANCGRCHTPLKDDHPDKSRWMSGGNEFKGKWGTSYAANLTPDRETGLGKWTDRQIIRAIRQGVEDDGEKLMPPMPVYSRITNRDIRAIVAYLRSLKPVRNRVPKPQPAQQERRR